MTVETPLLHHSECYGCQVRPPQGLGLEVYSDGGEVRCTYTVPDYAQGGPGIAHGGHLAALSDEFLAHCVGGTHETPAMTRSLDVKYRLPTPVGQELRISGRVGDEKGPTVAAHMSARLVSTGDLCFEATAVFARVGMDAWTGARAASSTGMSGDVYVMAVSRQIKYFAQWMRTHVRSYGPWKQGVVLAFDEERPLERLVIPGSRRVEVRTSSTPADAPRVAIAFRDWIGLIDEDATLSEYLAAGKAEVTGGPGQVIALLEALIRTERKMKQA